MPHAVDIDPIYVKMFSSSFSTSLVLALNRLVLTVYPLSWSSELPVMTVYDKELGVLRSVAVSPLTSVAVTPIVVTDHISQRCPTIVCIHCCVSISHTFNKVSFDTEMSNCLVPISMRITINRYSISLSSYTSLCRSVKDIYIYILYHMLAYTYYYAYTIHIQTI